MQTTDETRLAEMQATINRLSEFIRSQCRCPCCEEYEECVSECTFRDDAFSDWEQMQEARRALRGET